MKINLYFTLPVLIVAAVLTADCKKNKPDPAKYADYCAEVVRCDAQLKAQAMGQELCQKMFATVEEKLPALLDAFKGCLDAQPCDKKSVSACMSSTVQKSGMPFPGMTP